MKQFFTFAFIALFSVSALASGGPKRKNKNKAMYVADISYTVVSPEAYSEYDMLLFPGHKFGIAKSDGSVGVDIIGHWQPQAQGRMLVLAFTGGDIQYFEWVDDMTYVNISDKNHVLSFKQW